MTFRDALGRPVALSGPPRRIVSLVPSQTELLAALGLDEEIVGVTRFCTHPAGWARRKATVGGTKNARVDDILALEPDLVLGNKEENTAELVEALSPHVPVYVTDVSDLPGALHMMSAVGALVDRAVAATRLVEEIRAGFERLAEEVRGPAIPVAYLIWRGPYMTVGGDTFIHDMLKRAGLANVWADLERYPEVDRAAFERARPARILLSSEPYPFSEVHLKEVEALSPGAEAALVDGALFSWYGSRLRQTPSYLAELRRRWAQ